MESVASRFLSGEAAEDIKPVRRGLGRKEIRNRVLRPSRSPRELRRPFGIPRGGDMLVFPGPWLGDVFSLQDESKWLLYPREGFWKTERKHTRRISVPAGNDEPHADRRPGEI